MNFNNADIVQAINLIYNVASNNSDRTAASEMIEQAKDMPPQQVRQMANNLIDYDDQIVSAVGWNFIEHIIKYKWLELSVEERVQLRDECFLRICHLLPQDCSLHIMCRCIALMIEHEWPQNWPELFDHFAQVSKLSIAHSEVALLILQRLIEDVMTVLAIEDASRRKDLSNALGLHLPKVIQMILETLEKCFANLNDKTASVGGSALNVLSEIVQWVASKTLEPYIDVIIAAACRFLSLPFPALSEKAATCLCSIASRKRCKSGENNIVRSLFSDLCLQSILIAARTAVSSELNGTSGYQLLKVLCNTVSALGLHLADVWIKAPPNFLLYLTTIDSFFQHPSLYLRNEVIVVCCSFASRPEIMADPLFDQFLSKLVLNMPLLMEDVDYRADPISASFSQIDYDSEAHRISEFKNFRSRCTQVLRLASDSKHGEILYRLCVEWIWNHCALESRLSENASMMSIVSDSQWEGMVRIIRTAFSGSYTINTLNTIADVRKTCTELFDHIILALDSSTSHEVSNRLLSLLSALFVVLTVEPDHFIPFLHQIHRLLCGDGNDTSDERGVKRHCICLLLRLTKSFPDIVKAYAQNILDICVEARLHVSPMQLSSIVQVLAELSNLCLDYGTQRNFLAYALNDTISYFASSEIQRALESDANFILFCGFTSPASANRDDLINSIHIQNRLMLRSNLALVVGALSNARSVQPPEHPAFALLLPILQSIFFFVLRLISLNNPLNVSVVHPSYGPKLFGVPISERLQVLSAIVESSENSGARATIDDPVNYAQSFLFDVNDAVQSIIGLLARKMALHLFAQPKIDEWSMAMVTNIEHFPDFRLRFLIRRVWKPFLVACPHSVYPQLRLLYFAVAEELDSRLSRRWERVFASRIAEEQTEEEVFNENMTYLLTREIVNFLLEIYGIVDSGEEEKKDPLKDIQKMILFENDAVVFKAFASLASLCLVCGDSISACRSILVCRLSIHVIIKYSYFDLAPQLFIRCIQGMQINGGDEPACGSLLSLAFHIYYSLRNNCDSLSLILKKVPKCTEETFKSFDSSVQSIENGNGSVPDRVKKQLIKKILEPLIPTNIGETHRRPVQLCHHVPILIIPKQIEELDFTALGLIFCNEND